MRNLNLVLNSKFHFPDLPRFSKTIFSFYLRNGITMARIWLKLKPYKINSKVLMEIRI